MIQQSLLPANSTALEMATSEALDRLPELMAEYDKIRYEDLYANPSVLQALIAGYGLSDVTVYIPSLLNIIERGIEWQRVRGTPEAVRLGLLWLNYVAALEQAPVFRRKWHATQLRFPALPLNDTPDLGNIEGVTNLSMPARSFLRRGVYFYDIPAAEGNATRYNGSHLNTASGTKVAPGNTLWSFGRSAEFEHTLTEVEGVAIGNWLAPVASELAWEDADYPWEDADFPWEASGETARKTLMASWFEDRPVYLRLRDESGSVIGYRRARVARQVALSVDDDYIFDGYQYAPDGTGQIAYIEAMTDFDDADGVVAADVALVFGADLTDTAKPGKLWLPETGLSGGQAIALKTVSIPLRATVRDRFKFMLRF